MSVTSDGGEGNGASYDPVISADGHVVAFASLATNLVAGDTYNLEDVFVHDRQIGVTERVSVASDGTQAEGHSGGPALSADGRVVAFTSDAFNLVAGDTGSRDVFVRDRQTGVTERVSVAADGSQAFGPSSADAISADGRVVALGSMAHLAPGDGTWCSTMTCDYNYVRPVVLPCNNVFTRDRQTGMTELVSVAPDGTGGDDHGSGGAISADGRVVAFTSKASNLVVDDTSVCAYCGLPCADAFVRDRQTGVTELMSVASDGTQGDYHSFSNAISADGRVVAFTSGATNLVAGDTNDLLDVFVHDRQTGVTERLSVASDGTEGNGQSNDAAISADGRVVAFTSKASNLVAGDTNGTLDVFVHDRETGVTERVSVAADGSEGNDRSYHSALSADGRVVAFTSAASNLVAGDTNGTPDVFVRLPSTTTTLPCLSASCAVDAALQSPLCAGQTMPAGVTNRLGQAASLIDQDGMRRPKQVRRVIKRAKKLLGQAKARATRAAKGKKPKISSGCAGVLRDAADRVRASL